MKEKQKIDLITGVILTIASSIVLLLPINKITNVKYIFSGILIVYGITGLIKYFMTKESKDKEGLITTAISVAVTYAILVFDITSKPVNLALTLFVFVFLMSAMRIIKADYYHDRRNKMWLLEIASLMLFMVAGFLASINLYYTRDVQVIIIGFFFFINGILEIFDPIVIGYVRGR